MQGRGTCSRRTTVTAPPHALDSVRSTSGASLARGSEASSYLERWPRSYSSARTDRVEREVADQFERVRIAFDQDGVVSALEAMACFAMPTVEMLRIAG